MLLLKRVGHSRAVVRGAEHGVPNKDWYEPDQVAIELRGRAGAPLDREGLGGHVRREEPDRGLAPGVDPALCPRSSC